MFDAYLETGGNFLDIADIYAAGHSERMIGDLVAERGVREQVVMATKYGWPRTDGVPAGGNGVRNLRQALDGSLRRLRTDYVDLYWSHVWDRTTPAEEVLRGLTDAVRAGKILHYGFSNAPSWYVAEIVTLARAHGLPEPIGLPYGYPLVERGVELDILPVGEAFGLGLVAWGPLGAGLLTGKYDRGMLANAGQDIVMPHQQTAEATAGGDVPRLSGPNPTGGLPFTERNFAVVDAVREVAAEVDRPMAQVALAWLTRRPGVSSVLLGASRPEQITQNVAAAELELTADQLRRLDDASAIAPFNPYSLYRLPAAATFGTPVEPWPAR